MEIDSAYENMIEQRLNQDDTILALLAEDNEHAVSMLFDQYYELLIITVTKYLDNKEDADEIIQELFINIWTKRHTLNFSKPLSRYLLKAALNRTRNFLRDKTRSKEIIINPHKIQGYERNNSFSPDQNTLSIEEINQLVTIAKRRMSPRVRYTFILSRRQKFTYAEIAAYMGISMKGVEKNMTIALRILKEIFGPYLKSIVLVLITHLGDLLPY